MNSLSWKSLAVVSLALVIVGCGSSGPRLYKAGGTVTRNKVPVKGAQVTFAYDDGNFASGYTNAEGKFDLTYMNRPGGIPPGKCKVSVSKRGGVVTEKAPSAVLDAPPKSAEEQKAKLMAQQNQMQEFAKKQAELDAAGGSSGDFTKTGLEYEIKTNEAENNFVIEIKE